MLAQALQELWGKAVYVDNRTGAGGTIGAGFAAMSPPDGYTLLIANQSTLAIAPALQTDLKYDTLRDFAPIGRLAHVPYFLAVHSNIPAKNLAELISLARAKPGVLTFASLGDGTAGRLSMELLKTAEGIDVLTVPYRGAATAITDLVAGRVDMMFVDLVQVQGQVQAGTLRLIAVAGRTRARSAPNVPTLSEQVSRPIAVEPWYGLLAPARTPPDILARLSAGLREVHQTPAVQERLTQMGYEPIDDTPTRFSDTIRSDIDTFADVIKRMGFRPGP
jgi:tripartite-type tricarboxylate transporter receptor subunit TctC